MTKRQRLSSDDARMKILVAAKKCLIQQGIGGLRIANVAAEANIVHSSILHHFGSADGLKQALGKHLSIHLFEEMTSALSSANTEDMAFSAIHKLFGALGPGGHANLIAWLLIAEPTSQNHLSKIQENYTPLFDGIIELVQQNLTRIRDQNVSTDEARFIVYLVLIAACGQGVLGNAVSTSLGMANKQDVFLRWFADSIQPREPSQTF